MRTRWVLFAALALAGCETPAREPAPPPVAEAPPAAPPPAPRPVEDACGAAGMQHLVGHLRSEIPVPLKPQNQRVACTTCPVTMDYNPDRLNFFFDAATGVIKEVRCG